MIDVRFPTALQMLLTLAVSETEGYERMSSSFFVFSMLITSFFVRFTEYGMEVDVGACSPRQDY